MSATLWPPWLSPVPEKAVPFLDTVQPAGFGPLEPSWQAMTQAWVIIPLLGWSVVRMGGQERTQFLHNLCTNEVKALGPGQGCEAFLTDPKGHLVAQVFVLVGQEQLELVAVPGSESAIVEHLEYYHIVEDVHIEAVSSGRALFVLAGPGLAEKWASWKLSWQSNRPWSHLVPEAFPRWQVALIDWLAVPGALALGPEEEAGRFWTFCLEQGATAVGWACLDPARIAQGVPWFGQDITSEHLPQETARTKQAVSFTKGCYVGQETVARLESRGHVNRQLRLLRWNGLGEVPPVGTPLEYQGRQVGRVSSAAWHPGWEVPVGLALVRREVFAPGTQLQSPAGACEVLLPPGLET